MEGKVGVNHEDKPQSQEVVRDFHLRANGMDLKRKTKDQSETSFLDIFTNFTLLCSGGL